MAALLLGFHERSREYTRRLFFGRLSFMFLLARLALRLAGRFVLLRLRRGLCGSGLVIRCDVVGGSRALGRRIIVGFRGTVFGWRRLATIGRGVIGAPRPRRLRAAAWLGSPAASARCMAISKDNSPKPIPIKRCVELLPKELPLGP